MERGEREKLQALRGELDDVYNAIEEQRKLLEEAMSAEQALTTAVKPSRKSSALMSNLSLSNMPLDSAYFFSVSVKPRRKPVRCVPPSWVLMLLT